MGDSAKTPSKGAVPGVRAMGSGLRGQGQTPQAKRGQASTSHSGSSPQGASSQDGGLPSINKGSPGNKSQSNSPNARPGRTEKLPGVPSLGGQNSGGGVSAQGTSHTQVGGGAAVRKSTGMMPGSRNSGGRSDGGTDVSNSKLSSPANRMAARMKAEPPNAGPRKKGAEAQRSSSGEQQGAKSQRKFVKLKYLAWAIRAWFSVNRSVWRKGAKEAAELFKCYRTDGGKFRMRDLPLTPLTNHADQVARDELSMIAEGVYQSNWRAAEEIELMKEKGISHVLSTFEPEENPYPEDFTYLNLVFEDDEEEDPSRHFHAAASFIREGVTSGGCLIHCAAGVSRSSSLTLSYMIRELRMTLREAFTALRERRPTAWPNTGFMAKLVTFEGSIYPGRCSIDISKYQKWTEENSEAVVVAKTVDRDRSFRRSSTFSRSASNPQASTSAAALSVLSENQPKE